MKRLLTAILLVFALQSAWAIDINSAKNQGLVGEARTGYLAAVKSPASAEVKAQFERTARNTNTTVPQVANRFYELAVQKTRPGHFYQDRNGRWKKK